LRLLFDHNLPAPLRRDLPRHEVVLAAERGWAELRNGDLLSAAEAAGFQVLITVDKKLRYQQNLAGRRIGLVILSTQTLEILRGALSRIEASIQAAGQGGYHELDLPRPALIRRPPPEQTR
jgi:predicted nuclease of predicted toxin-antitoxin system